MCTMGCFKWASKNLSKIEVKGKRVIEVGSYDVNGSLRYLVSFMEPSEYIGVDIENGPGVDIICPAENLVNRFGKECFDIVLSTCMLEHSKNWKINISNIKNICKPNGTILVIVPSVWPYHEYPYDFWRYKKEDIEVIFSDCDILVLEEDNQKPSLVYAKIKKPDNFSENDLTDYKLYSVIVNKRINEIQNKDLKCFNFRRLVFKMKIKNMLSRISSSIF